jgi:hypothetical protein
MDGAEKYVQMKAMFHHNMEWCELQDFVVFAF